MFYRTLGSSGCAVSAFCLGTMTFGNETDEEGSHTQLDRFVEAGGTFVDTADGWFERLGLPFDAADTGYGHSSEQVGLVKLSADQLLGYYDAVHARTADFLRTVTDEGLDRIVDRRWNPPVTLGVRLVSVIDDCAQHSGQAAYVKGLLS